MSRLTSAHRGYEYQDLLVACRFVDMLLGSVVDIYVDQKLINNDRFDDLTTIDIFGHRERIQFKHTDNNDRPLTLRTFTTDARGLRLDLLIASILTDRDGPGSEASTSTFRIVLRDQVPNDLRLKDILKRLDPDPGPFLPGVRTVRLGFDSIKLWQQRNAQADQTNDCPFAFLFSQNSPLEFDDLRWVCERLIVEVSAPSSSGDLTAPDLAEHLLLTRVRAEVGAESFPNTERSAIDVAEALISTARASRQDRIEPTIAELLRRAQLRSDFGAVARAHPVDPMLEVKRAETVHQLLEEATKIACNGGYLIVEGPPGQGKSWACQQLLTALVDGGWLTAEHYCFLGDADGERLERVLAESVYGSLLSRLAEADPRVVTDHRPRFSADEDAVLGCLRRALRYEPNRKVALVVDGIDHITRIRNRSGFGFDPSRSLSESLAALDLPSGTVLIVLSQPGHHLEPLGEAGAKAVVIPGLDKHELSSLSIRLNVIPEDINQASSAAQGEETKATFEFLDVLAELSKGNALYATYLCREVLRFGEQVDFPAALRKLPPFDGTLKNYYDHLYDALESTAAWVADVIALIDFSVTRDELREIRPSCSRYVDKALAVLKPVLIERATQGGVRIYHESFARYLRERLRDDVECIKALLNCIADWLKDKGFFDDPRAFRSLLTILSDAGEHQAIVELVDREFVSKAIASGFSTFGTTANLAMAISSATKLGDWLAAIRYVELSRAAESFQYERFESRLISFVDVPASLLGANTLADLLIYDDHLVMPARDGLQMCAALDKLGATAPWNLYMTGYLRETEKDNTSYGEASERTVALAYMRGRLRLAQINPENNQLYFSSRDLEPFSSNGNEEVLDFTEPVEWKSFAEYIESSDLPMGEVMRIVEDTHGMAYVIRVINNLTNSSKACLALAERLKENPLPDNEIGSSRSWATAVVQNGIPTGCVHRLLRLGIEPKHLANETDYSREKLFELTRRVQERSVRWEKGLIGSWLDACSLSSHLDHLGLSTAEALITKEGWYRCWLRFVIGLSRSEAGELDEKGNLALEALELLTEDLRPFSGEPRACDLYPLHGVIRNTIRRAMNLLDDNQWIKGINTLNEVSTSLDITLQGAQCGPIPRDFLLQIVVKGATTSSRYNAAKNLINDEIGQGSANRYYADLAEYQLLAARLALTAQNQELAKEHWKQACTFLSAYGWRKDRTIFELLDPLDALIEKDPARARLCISTVQGLCERVPLHTDGKGTRHAWSHWWELLAKADPVATVHLAVPQLLSSCNDPDRLLHHALEKVWKEWVKQSDPLVAGALRVTLDSPLHRADSIQLKCLKQDHSTNFLTIHQLMTWLLARVDERPTEYSSVSNSAELISKDNDEVVKLNTIAEPEGLPPIRIGHDFDSESSSNLPVRDARFDPLSLSECVNERVVNRFPSGWLGLTRAIRVWRRRPYDTKSPKWSVERFANIIGYRLLELLEEGRHQEAKSALHSLAEGAEFGDRTRILRPLAEGLERYGRNHLAAIAYTLTWTHTGGQGGWLTFGGKTEIEALHKATELDSQITSRIVAQEIERVVATKGMTYGITQAIIHAFSVSALVSHGQSSVDVAFEVWKEAYAVIAARAPRVSSSDDPDFVYQPLVPDTGDCAPGNLDTALALAALGGLAHPSREKKRRAFLAAKLLIEERSEIAAPAFNIALASISCPATLTWLLRLIELSEQGGQLVRETCQTTLSNLTTIDLLTVRALARRLITGEQPPLATPRPIDSTFLSGNNNIWIPDNIDPTKESDSIDQDSLIDAIAGRRIQQSEPHLPRIGSAVRACVASSFTEETFKKRLQSQLETLSSRHRFRWPNAFLAQEELIERVLQNIAASGRVLRCMDGEFIADPINWEDQLASTLLDDPSVPIQLEAHRQPRPQISQLSGNGPKILFKIQQSLLDNSKQEFIEATEKNNCLHATLHLESVNAASVVKGGKFKGWRWLAVVEKRFTQHPDWKRKVQELYSSRSCALEVRHINDKHALTLPPFASGDFRLWNQRVAFSPENTLFEKSQPLFGIDQDMTMTGDGHHGLGITHPLLVPMPSLITYLRLHPGEQYCLEDANGPALALVTWRAEYATSDYYLAWPRVTGSGIVMRSDLKNRLMATMGDFRFILRTYIEGETDMLSIANT